MSLRNAPWSWYRRQWALGAPAGDTAVPTKPGNLVASDVTAETLTLTWGASTDNVGVVSYRVEYAVDGDAFAWLATVAAPTVTLDVTGLTASTAYRFRVLAEDAAGNQSAWEPDAAGLLVTTAVARRTFLRFDGVSQHAWSAQVAQDLMPGDGLGGAGELSSGYLCGVWIRGAPPPIVGAFRVLTNLHSSAGAQRGVLQDYVHSSGQQNAFAAVTRDGPSVVTQGRTWNVSYWPDGQYFREDRWSLIAVAASKANLQWTRYYDTARVGQSLDAGELTPFAGGVQPLFAPGYRWFLGGRTDVSTDAFVPNSACPGDFRAPFIYRLGSESWAAIDALIGAIYAAGPAYDHSAADGWWPGDGDSYPTIRNLGTEGAAWDLTLANGSQAMIMEEP